MDRAVRLRREDRDRPPGESAGLLPSFWSGSTIGNVPIGQGISVTAIQLASVYAAIANGGEWIQPHLVDHVQGVEAPPPLRRRILSSGVDAELLKMLKGVVSDVGTAAAAEIPGYTVAGKTGTAQKPGPHGYMPGKYVATFVGIVPAGDPRLVVLVETELWPELLAACGARRIPVGLVNARVSDRSFAGYRAIRSILRPPG